MANREHLREMDNELKRITMQHPVYVSSLGNNERYIIKNLKKENDKIVIELREGCHIVFNNEDYIVSEDCLYFIVIYKEDETSSIATAELHCDNEHDPIDAIYFVEGEEYYTFKLEGDDHEEYFEFCSEELPQVLKDRVYSKDMINLFPFVEEKMKYTVKNECIYATTDLYLFLNPSSLFVYPVDTVSTRIKDKIDFELHENKVSSLKTLYRRMHTLDIVKGSIMIERSSDQDKIMIIDSIYDGSLRGWLLEPLSESMDEAFIPMNKLSYCDTMYIQSDVPIFKYIYDDTDTVEVLLSPYEEDDERNNGLMVFTGYLAYIYGINRLLSSIDYDKINMLIDKVKDGGRIDRKRNKAILALTEAYKIFYVFTQSYDYNYAERCVSTEIYVYDISLSRLCVINPYLLLSKYEYIEKLARELKILWFDPKYSEEE